MHFKIIGGGLLTPPHFPTPMDYILTGKVRNFISYGCSHVQWRPFLNATQTE